MWWSSFCSLYSPPWQAAISSLSVWWYCDFKCTPSSAIPKLADAISNICDTCAMPPALVCCIPATLILTPNPKRAGFSALAVRKDKDTPAAPLPNLFLSRAQLLPTQHPYARTVGWREIPAGSYLWFSCAAGCRSGASPPWFLGVSPLPLPSPERAGHLRSAEQGGRKRGPPYTAPWKPANTYPQICTQIAFFSDTAMPFINSPRERSVGAISLYCELVAPSPPVSLGQPLRTWSGGVSREDPRRSPPSCPDKEFVQRSINNTGFQQCWLNRLSLCVICMKLSSVHHPLRLNFWLLQA